MSFIKCCGALHATGKLLLWEKVASEPCSVVYPVPGCPSPKWARIPWPTSAPPSHLQHPRQRCGPIPKPSFPGATAYQKRARGAERVRGRGAGERAAGHRSRCLAHPALARCMHETQHMAGQPCSPPPARAPEHCLQRGVSQPANLHPSGLGACPSHAPIVRFAAGISRCSDMKSLSCSHGGTQAEALCSCLPCGTARGAICPGPQTPCRSQLLNTLLQGKCRKLIFSCLLLPECPEHG